MRWAYADSRASLILRRWLARLGVGAPRMAVRTQLPWTMRGFVWGVALALAVAAGGWLFDAGRRSGGFDQVESARQVQALRGRIWDLERETAKLRAIAHASESNLKMERAAQDQLAAELRALQDENARLKQDMAFFDNLEAASAGGASGPSIDRLQVEPDSVTGQYRYRMLLVYRSTDRSPRYSGSYELHVALERSGKRAMMVLPQGSGTDSARFRLDFRYFRSVSGVFRVPDGSRALSVEVKLLQRGAVKASQTVLL